MQYLILINKVFSYREKCRARSPNELLGLMRASAPTSGG